MEYEKLMGDLLYESAQEEIEKNNTQLGIYLAFRSNELYLFLEDIEGIKNTNKILRKYPAPKTEYDPSLIPRFIENNKKNKRKEMRIEINIEEALEDEEYRELIKSYWKQLLETSKQETDSRKPVIENDPD